MGLCVKNAEKTIQNCVESIVGQNYPKKLMTVIVVDGNSTDKTVELAEKQLLGSGLSSQFRSDHGEGLGAARQIVLDNSTQKYIIWIDGDARVQENFIDEQVKFMEEKPRVCVATGTFVRVKYPNESLALSLDSIAKYLGSTAFCPGKSDHGIPPNDTSIYRVEALRQIGGFDTSIRGAGEDEDVISRMRKNGWTITVNPRAYYHAFPKATWYDLWKEQSWFGYGSHYISHKDKTLRVRMHHIPFIRFYVEIRAGSVAYRLTSEKKAFLFPLADIFMTVAWWCGYFKSHIRGYGH